MAPLIALQIRPHKLPDAGMNINGLDLNRPPIAIAFDRRNIIALLWLIDVLHHRHNLHTGQGHRHLQLKQPINGLLLLPTIPNVLTVRQRTPVARRTPNAMISPATTRWQIRPLYQKVFVRRFWTTTMAFRRLTWTIGAILTRLRRPTCLKPAAFHTTISPHSSLT